MSISVCANDPISSAPFFLILPSDPRGFTTWTTSAVAFHSLWAPTSLFRSISATSHIWVCSESEYFLAELTISFKSAFRSQLGSIFPSSQEEESQIWIGPLLRAGVSLTSSKVWGEESDHGILRGWGSIRASQSRLTDKETETQKSGSAQGHTVCWNLATAGELVSWHPVQGVCHHSLCDLQSHKYAAWNLRDPPHGCAPCP